MTVDTFTEIVAWLAFPFGAFIIGMSLMVFLYYIRHGHRYFLHIGLMALSYMKFAVLMVLTINFRIFFDGTPRFIGAVVMLTAAIEGVVGLLLMFQRRKRALLRSLDG